MDSYLGTFVIGVGIRSYHVLFAMPPENPQAPHAIASQPSQPAFGRKTGMPLLSQVSTTSRRPSRSPRSATGGIWFWKQRRTMPGVRAETSAFASLTRCVSSRR